MNFHITTSWWISILVGLVLSFSFLPRKTHKFYVPISHICVSVDIVTCSQQNHFKLEIQNRIVNVHITMSSWISILVGLVLSYPFLPTKTHKLYVPISYIYVSVDIVNKITLNLKSNIRLLNSTLLWVNGYWY